MSRNNTARAQKTLLLEQDRLRQYVDKGVQKKIARNYPDIETQRDILADHIEKNHSELMRLFNANYYKEIDQFIAGIEQAYPKEVKKGEDEALGLKKRRTRRKMKPGKEKIGRKKQVVERKGKKYKRTIPKRFENKKFLKKLIRVQTKRGKTTKEITKVYNRIATKKGWAKRTPKSISNFRYRNELSVRQIRGGN